MKPVSIKKMHLEEFIEMLKKDGIEISTEEAAPLLELIYYFSSLLIKEFLGRDTLIR